MVTGQNGKWVCHKHGAFADMGPTERLQGDRNHWGQLPWPECPACLAIQKNDICRECEQHPAAINYSTDAMSAIHGFTERICRCCFVSRIEKHLEEVTEGLAKAKADLSANPCDPYAPEAL
jgi:hypothetical protein